MVAENAGRYMVNPGAAQAETQQNPPRTAGRQPGRSRRQAAGGDPAERYSSRTAAESISARQAGPESKNEIQQAGRRQKTAETSRHNLVERQAGRKATRKQTQADL